jgi:hypothetical protein
MRTQPPEQLQGFEDLYWLFSCGFHNRATSRIDLDEASLLYRTTARSRGAILEIGRRHGGSTIVILVASQGRPFISLDFEPNHFQTADRFLRDATLARNLQLLVKNSREPLPGHQFGFVFFDGDHSFHGLRLDIIAHWSSIRSFAEIPALAAFHDVDAERIGAPADSFDLQSTNPIDTVTAVVSRLIQSGAGKVVSVAGSLMVIEKIAEVPADF